MDNLFSFIFSVLSDFLSWRERKRQEETDKRRQEETRRDRQEEARGGKKRQTRGGKRRQEETYKAGIQHEKKEE